MVIYIPSFFHDGTNTCLSTENMGPISSTQAHLFSSSSHGPSPNMITFFSLAKDTEFSRLMKRKLTGSVTGG